MDLDTFAYEHGMAREIHADLVRIVSTLNFVHETLMCGAMGAKAWGDLTALATGVNPPGFLEVRRRWMERLVLGAAPAE